MASLAELARIHTSLSGRAIGHLQRLVAGWGLLADFCFADLLLFIPTVDSEDGDRFVVLGQVRPSTSQTVYRADRSEEHTSELQSLMRTSYAVICLTKQTQ